MASIINATTTAGVTVQGDNSGSLQLATNNGTTAVTINTGQNVGIGTASPAAKLHVQSSGNTYLQIEDTLANGYNAANLYKNSERMFRVGVLGTVGGFTNGALVVYDETAAAWRMVIDSSGNVLVNTTSSTGHKMTVQSAAGAGGIDCVGGATNGYYAMRVDMPSTNTYGVLFRNNGNNVGDIRINSSSTTYNTSSDYRLKENIAPMTGALAKVAQLKPCTYTWKVDGSDGQGFIAHELQALVPDAVTGEKDAVETYIDEKGDEQTRIKPQGIDTSFLVATLTAAIQELKAELDATKAEVQALKGTL